MKDNFKKLYELVGPIHYEWEEMSADGSKCSECGEQMIIKMFRCSAFAGDDEHRIPKIRLFMCDECAEEMKEIYDKMGDNLFDFRGEA